MKRITAQCFLATPSVTILMEIILVYALMAILEMCPTVQVCNYSQWASNNKLLHSITDIDECALNSTNSCHKDANCTDTEGNYTCECHDGFTGDGFNCTGMYSSTQQNLDFVAINGIILIMTTKSVYYVISINQSLAKASK